MPPHHPPLRLHINTHVSLSMNAAAQSVRYARTQVVAVVILTKEIGASEDWKRQQTRRAEYACELEALKSLSAPAAASQLDLSLVNELHAVKKVIGTSR